ncbi:o-succinylbenzoate synthase [bacterium (Candidatus Blackallbacteria) CG17_big_fil_post_rev_8_21_14_2_50_48_46]|uniref:o-succinylbenzoate synthase n=1 Tax=bacterium (Candidatus Blackallbacteria) CG17_big_fil_post_rev_8_21_14_2_50_48_46 TaxID=2014261 RepID=A0A2M7FXW9_9BACT|nr:MAG: o-succinylbenzoate synthase [bacterium (Candidatus Blackallbacteria) CG18_big_fil_WC_8_21_14_2_50_49_26]PIW13843.1 MAG: o-succinylbenzoate synthase [bacterium (Candidatus Blackallbacteria) CG17_big_fil_post_rev_8_21_14_2_50_48_46]PIW45069.1 MAG: o-succinylbenzoate synthase [bacterium (Candidatus Blackallbacteria) CG13_big_fil_rev_8_21_14_2_50_49_14]
MQLKKLWSYHLPLRVPLEMKYGLLEARQGLFFEIRRSDGSRGWGEVAPFPGLSTDSLQEAQTWLVQNAQDLRPSSAERFPALAWGLKMAQDDVFRRELHSVEIPLNALLTAADPLTLAQESAAYYAQGYRCFKLKVGFLDLLQDTRRVHAIFDATASDIQLRLDANRSWNLPEALARAQAWQDLPFAYIEEPLRDLADLSVLAQETAWSLVLDESLMAFQPEHLPWHTLAGIVLKPMLLGAAQTETWIQAARARNRTLTLSSVFESAWGLGFLALRAAQLKPVLPAGLDTWRVFSDSFLASPFRIQAGALILEPKMLDKPLLNTVYLKKIQF